MERHALSELAGKARIHGSGDGLEWAERRRRLERLAGLLETTRAPVRLFTTMECYPRRERLRLRQDRSPLALAFHDAQFRREGLTGDSVGEGMAFFHLSMGEAHDLLCDCGYGGLAMFRTPLAMLVARRARKLAARRNLAEWRALLAIVAGRLKPAAWARRAA